MAKYVHVNNGSGVNKEWKNYSHGDIGDFGMEIEAERAENVNQERNAFIDNENNNDQYELIDLTNDEIFQKIKATIDNEELAIKKSNSITNNSKELKKNQYTYWTTSEQIVLLAGVELHGNKFQKFKAILNQFAEYFKPEHQDRVFLKNKYDYIIKEVKKGNQKYKNLQCMASGVLKKLKI